MQDQNPRNIVEYLGLNLQSEEHDDQMSIAYEYLLNHGIKKTMKMFVEVGDWHLYKDFFRLIRAIYQEKDSEAFKEKILKDKKGKISSLLEYSTYEIKFFAEGGASERSGAEQNYSFNVNAARQLFSAIKDISSKETPHFTLELCKEPGNENVIFLVSIPRKKTAIVEKNIDAILPKAKAFPRNGDANIFVQNGFTNVRTVKFAKYEGLPILPYEKIAADPLMAILNAFSKMDRENDGASLQLTINTKDGRLKTIKKVLKKVEKGKSLTKAVKEVNTSAIKEILKELWIIIKEMVTNEDDSENKKDKSKDDDAGGSDAAMIRSKISDFLAGVNFSLVTSSTASQNANSVMADLISTLSQFADPEANAFKAVAPKDDREKGAILENYIFRRYDKKYSISMSYKEIAQIFHTPATIMLNPNIKAEFGKKIPPPFNMPSEGGVIIGVNDYGGTERAIRFIEDDRMRHLYVVGQTGTGKTGIMMTLLAQDIQAGHGVAYLDPHGEDIQKIFAFIPPERYDDVVYFDPSYLDYPMGLNMLEYDKSRPHEISLVLDELMSIFNHLFDMKTQGGPMFQQYFRNSARLAMLGMEENATLMDISRILANADFRKDLISKVTEPDLKEFWGAASRAGGEQKLENFHGYITSKIDPMINNEILKYIILQRKTSLRFREIMDEGKILLVNLSKGLLGNINQSLLGLIIMGKFQLSAMSRAENPLTQHRPFYLYIDEFQNFVTPSAEKILSEARKYKLSMTMANQYIKQLGDEIKNAVLGNVGTVASFRVSKDTAEELLPMFTPYLTLEDLSGQPARHAYIRMLINGQPSSPFNIKTLDYRNFMYFNPAERRDLVEKIKMHALQKYATPKEEVRKEILSRFDKHAPDVGKKKSANPFEMMFGS